MNDWGGSGSGLLDGRRILITGAASGIGRAAVGLFAAEGASLGLLDRDAAVQDAGRQTVSSHSAMADLSDARQVEESIAALATAMGGLDGVVNCAGIVGAAPFDELRLEVWQSVIATNLTGTFLVCRAALPFLRARPNSTIVNVASISAFSPGANAAAYAASKGGVVSLTKALAVELAPTIRVNCVCPGITATPLALNGLAAQGRRPEEAESGIALKRLADPLEIAQALLFLSATQSSFVTGSVLSVDGGRIYH